MIKLNILLKYDYFYTNEKGLAVLGELVNVKLGTKAKLLIKSLKFIQMSNRIPSSPNWCKIVLQKLRLIPSSPNNAKPYVVCSASCQCKFKIIQTNNWIAPKDDDNAWGLSCIKCNTVINTGFTKKELKNMLN